MHLDEYMSLDATALAELVAGKQVTSAELVALARRRADAVNPRLNAIVRRLDDVADRQTADPDQRGAFAGPLSDQRSSSGVPGLSHRTRISVAGP